MSRYIARRLLVALATVLAVAFVVRSTISLTAEIPPHLHPTPVYDAGTHIDGCRGADSWFVPHRMLAVATRGETAEFDASCALIPEKSLYERAIEWVGLEIEWISSALRGDLGRSLYSGEAVSEQITRRLHASVQLALMAMAIAVLNAVPLGVLAAVRHDHWPDHISRLASLTGHAVPEFLLATVVFFALSYWVGWLPDLAYPTVWENPTASLLAFLFPALIVGWRIGAISMRMTRSAVLDVLREDYVRTARAKGLSERSVVVRHALRNALLPVMTIMGNQLPALLAGLVVIEIVFGIPGLGTLWFDALQLQDYPVVQGVVFVTALCVITSNLVVDVARAAMDPRIRYP